MRLTTSGRFIAGGTDRRKLTLQQRAEHILASGKLTRREHLDLTSALLADQSLTERDRRQINRVLELVRLQKLELVD